MRYKNVVTGTFVRRHNRFVAEVIINGSLETVHVKNTGRMGELLFPDAKVALTCSDNPNRKTKYDLISVYKESLGWVNIDSQAPNKIVGEWLATQDYTFIKPEYKYGDSRLDFYMEKGDEKYLMEVKGCTLEINGIGYFLALREQKVPATLHVYPTGGHGWGFRDSFTYKRQWTGELEKWLREGLTFPEK